MVGIKETKEVINGVQALGVATILAVKKYGPTKAPLELVELFLTDAEFKGVLTAAVENITAVQAELKDVDLNEGFELGKEGIELVKAVIDALTKEAV